MGAADSFMAMEKSGLAQKIEQFIQTRLDDKLEKLEKEYNKDKKAAKGDEQKLLALAESFKEKKEGLVEKYEIREWLNNAAKRAQQIQLVTHAQKYTHPDAKGTNFYSLNSKKSSQFMDTSWLVDPAIDTIGNAAALDVGAFLQLEHNGKTVFSLLKEGNSEVFSELSGCEDQAEAWVNDFKTVFYKDQRPSSHLSKQMYFPIDESNYHLIAPIFPSSLANELYQKINDSIFSKEAKEAKKARKEKKFSEHKSKVFPGLGELSFGGTKPQNISQLNSKRGGRAFLLNCAPPHWNTVLRPPLKINSIFYGPFGRRVRIDLLELRDFIAKNIHKPSTKLLRDIRAERIEKIIDQFLQFGAEIQSLTEHAGWSAKPDCNLPEAQKLWLDPLHVENDKNFKEKREKGEWREKLAKEFAAWLIKSLEHKDYTLSDTEFKEWKVALERRISLLKQDLENDAW